MENNIQCAKCKIFKEENCYTLGTEDRYSKTCLECRKIINKKKYSKRKLSLSIKDKIIKYEALYDENNVLIAQKCAKCLQVKELKHYFKNKSRKTGFDKYCKECRHINRISLSEDKKTLERQKNNERYHKNKEKINEEIKFKRKYDQEYREKYLCYRKEYYSKKENIIRKNITSKEYFKKRKTNDPFFKMLLVARSRLRNEIKKCFGKKTKNFSEFLGIDYDSFKKYIEEQFTDKMNWDNYGSYWVIDHIKPCCSYDLSILEQQQECFNYKNLRPLEKKDNLIKAGEDRKISIRAKK